MFRETNGVKSTKSTNGSAKSTIIDVNKPVYDPLRRRMHSMEKLTI